MEIQVATLCDAATDYNAKLCILGAFDTIGVAKLPAEHPQCAVALRLIFTDIDAGKHKLTVRMIDADGAIVKPVEIESTFEVRMPDNLFFFSRNLVIGLQRLKFEKTGQYSIDVAVDDEIKSRIPLQVVEIKQPKK
ncbi:MAG: hypothetical protein ACI8QF_001743 [Limisphaerales bacterium]|jgi:hypothetical protein